MGGLTHRVMIASGLLATIISASFAVLLVSITKMHESVVLARESQAQLEVTGRLSAVLHDLQTDQRAFILTRQERFLRSWETARTAFSQVAWALARSAEPAQWNRARWIAQAGTSDIQRYSVPLVEAARRGDGSAGGVTDTPEGERHFNALRAELDRFTTTERSLHMMRRNAAEASARRVTGAAATGLAGSTLLVVMFAGYLTRAIVRPVRQAATMADRLADGDLAVRIPEAAASEIGALDRAFNSMAGSLEESRDKLGRLAGEQVALRHVATLVARGAPPPTVFAAVAEEVGRVMGADLTRMLHSEPDETATVVAAWGRPDALLPIGAQWTIEGHNIPSMVLDSGAPARMDCLVGAVSPLCVYLREHGVRSGVGTPITVEGNLWGVMTAFSTHNLLLPRDAETRICDFTDLVATAIANTQARSDLTASRARVVAATDQTRRRIERDLHDGTQQRLVSLALDVRAAESNVPAELPKLRAQLSTLANGLAGALDDLQEISRGIHPAILSEGGLGPALKSLARRSGIPVELDVDIGDRLPEATEVAAYYVVAETLTNTTKHAQASFVHVEAVIRDRRLYLSVRDDGIGGADPAHGTGLIGLTDRIEALNGTITVASPAGRGTALRAELPIGGG